MPKEMILLVHGVEEAKTTRGKANKSVMKELEVTNEKGNDTAI